MLIKLGLTYSNDILSMLRLALFPLLHVILLYLGPLVTYWINGDIYNVLQGFNFWTSNRFIWLLNIRNHLIGPISEEIVFRACMGTLFTHTTLSTTSIVLLSSLIFGMAHLHHAWGAYVMHRHYPNALKIALTQTGK
jgi:prenyl protein peptidase